MVFFNLRGGGLGIKVFVGDIRGVRATVGDEATTGVASTLALEAKVPEDNIRGLRSFMDGEATTFGGLESWRDSTLGVEVFVDDDGGFSIVVEGKVIGTSGLESYCIA